MFGRHALVSALVVLAACGGGSGSEQDGAGRDGSGNLPPAFTLSQTAALEEDSASPDIELSKVSAGSEAEDASQSLTFLVESSNAAVISGGEVLGSGAQRTLRLELVPNASGPATVRVTARDSAGAVHTREVAVTVAAVNDAPTLTAPPPQDLQSATQLSVQLAGIGPGGGEDERGQGVTLEVSTNNPSLFSSLDVSSVGGNGTAHVTGRIVPGVRGLAEITITARDGQPVNGATSVSFSLLANEDRPSLQVTGFPSQVQSGCASFDVRLAHPTAGPTSVRLEFDVGSGFRPGTLQSASSQALSTSPAGQPHQLVWRSNVDLADVQSDTVRVRLTPLRGPFEGESVVVEGVRIDNRLRLAEARSFPSGPGTLGATLADLNLDGHIDVVTPDSYLNTVSIMYGQAGGTFATPVAFAAGPATCGGSPAKPFSVNVSDQNGDNFGDILVFLQNCQSMGVLLSNGQGGFHPYVNYPLGNTPLFGVSEDFNGDGTPDVAVVNFVSNDLSVLFGTADGGFGTQTRLPAGGNPNKVVQGHMNEDGHIDLVVANAVDDTFSIFFGNGQGGFERRDFAAGNGPRNLAVGDLNGDGRMDVVTANPGDANNATSATVMLQTASGGFTSPVEYVVGVHPRSVAMGDVNGDGHLDVAIGNIDGHSINNVMTSTVSLLMGRGDGSFHTPSFWPVRVNGNGGTGPHSVEFRDMDGDDRLDLVTGNTNTHNFSILRNEVPVCSP